MNTVIHKQQIVSQKNLTAILLTNSINGAFTNLPAPLRLSDA